ncbi:MAG: DNA polymerase IV, partial [Bacteroidetes bacterium]|nr:DNA polymerase IV [Bacteroidota bacterium]
TTFNQDETDPQRLKDTLRTLASEVGYIARRKGLKGRVITLKIRLKGFATHTHQQSINEASNVDAKIFQVAWDLYQKSGLVGQPVRLIGVGISDWRANSHQGDLFDDPEEREREERLYATLDDVTEKFGKGTISMGLKIRNERAEQ